MAYLFLGIIIGVVSDKYLFPILDLFLDVFQYKQSEKAADYQLSMQAKTFDFARDYPESQQNNQELQPAIGFVHEYPEEDFYDEEDEEENYKGKIGFKK